MAHLKFIRLALIDDYNCGMGHVDASDHLFNQYHFSKWTRKVNGGGPFNYQDSNYF